MKCLPWIKNYTRHFTHYTFLNPLKEVLSPLDKTRLALFYLYQTSSGATKNLIPNFSHHAWL